MPRPRVPRAATRTCARSPNDLDVLRRRATRRAHRPAVAARRRRPRTASPAWRACSAAGLVERDQHAPSCSSATRPQRSASSRYGVAITIVRPVGQELRQQLPELAPRHRIDAGRRFVEQQHVAARGPACTRARASASCRPTADRRAASRNGVSCVIVEEAIARRARSAARRASPRRTRCSRRWSDRRRAEALREIADVAGDRACSATGSWPSTRTRPRSARSSPQASRIAVVLPAPSGPMNPNISPRRTANDTSSSAVHGAVPLGHAVERRARRRSLLRDLRFHRHARLQQPSRLSVVTLMRYTSLERSSAVCTLRGVNSAFGEMNVIVPVEPLAGVGHERHRLAERQPRHDRLVDVDVRPGTIEVGDDDDRRARRDQLAGVDQLRR